MSIMDDDDLGFSGTARRLAPRIVYVESVTYDGFSIGGVHRFFIWRFNRPVLVAPGNPFNLLGIVNGTEHFADTGTITQYDATAIRTQHTNVSLSFPGPRWEILGPSALIFPGGIWDPVARGYDQNLLDHTIGGL